MTEYQFHWPIGTLRTPIPGIKLNAQSERHGAALALRHFMDLGCDITAPLAHVDMIEQDGTKHMLLVEEVLDWLHEPTQTPFVQREGLAVLFQ